MQACKLNAECGKQAASKLQAERKAEQALAANAKRQNRHGGSRFADLRFAAAGTRLLSIQQAGAKAAESLSSFCCE